MPSSSTPPQIDSLVIIGPDEGDISSIVNPAYSDADRELARLAGWPSANVRFVEGGGLYGTPAQVRSLLTRFGGAQ